MLPSTGYVTGFCLVGRHPEAHDHCHGGVTQGAVDADGVAARIDCTCLCHTPERDEFIAALWDAISWTTVDRETNTIKKWRTEAEARAYAKTQEPVCRDCNGVGAVPAGGGEPAEEVDNGYVACPTCNQPPAAVYVNVNEEGEDYDASPDLATALAVRDRFPNDTVEVRPVRDRNHHLTAQGSQRLEEWAQISRTDG